MGRIVETKQKAFLPKSLMGRSLLIIIVPVVLFQLGMGYFFIERHWKSMTERLSTALIAEMRYVSQELEQAESADKRAEIIARAKYYFGLEVTYEADATLPRFYEPDWRYNAYNEFAKIFRRQWHQQFDLTFNPAQKFFDVKIQTKEAVITFRAPERRIYTATTYIFLVWMFSIGFILLIIALLFMRNQIRPIHKLALAAERFGKGYDTSGLKISGAREVRQAIRAFLDMRSRISRQVEQRTAMLSGISHDLRTPLTRMKLQLALLPESADTASLKADVSDMEKMVEAYLSFIRGEGDEARSQLMVQELLLKLQADFKRQNHDFTLMIEAPSLALHCKPYALERALTNIIGNAFKYASKAEVRVFSEEGYAVIAVSDDGAGIPENRYDDVFKPFVRLEQSRNEKTGGMGLGLSIAQDIINSHGGEIVLSPSSFGGLCVMVKLPL
jgi:two-component system osmolarity sensor histidine kinase EnvZ